MKRKSRIGLPANPFLAWTALAWKLGEMSFASAQVISHRTTRMVAAGTTPNARDRREFALMGQEKVEAAAEAVQAMATQVTNAHVRLGMRAARHAAAGTAAFVSLAASRSPSQFMARQAKLALTLARSAKTATQLAESSARLAQKGLEPIHARATANAKRLRKR